MPPSFRLSFRPADLSWRLRSLGSAHSRTVRSRSARAAALLLAAALASGAGRAEQVFSDDTGLPQPWYFPQVLAPTGSCWRVDGRIGHLSPDADMEILGPDGTPGQRVFTFQLDAPEPTAVPGQSVQNSRQIDGFRVYGRGPVGGPGRDLPDYPAGHLQYGWVSILVEYQEYEEVNGVVTPGKDGTLQPLTTLTVFLDWGQPVEKLLNFQAVNRVDMNEPDGMGGFLPHVNHRYSRSFFFSIVERNAIRNATPGNPDGDSVDHFVFQGLPPGRAFHAVLRSRTPGFDPRLYARDPAIPSAPQLFSNGDAGGALGRDAEIIGVVDGSEQLEFFVTGQETWNPEELNLSFSGHKQQGEYSLTVTLLDSYGADVDAPPAPAGPACPAVSGNTLFSPPGGILNLVHDLELLGLENTLTGAWSDSGAPNTLRFVGNSLLRSATGRILLMGLPGAGIVGNNGNAIVGNNGNAIVGNNGNALSAQTGAAIIAAGAGFTADAIQGIVAAGAGAGLHPGKVSALLSEPLPLDYNRVAAAIVASGAGGGVISSGAGGIVAVGAGAAIVAPGAGIVGVGAGAGIVGTGAGIVAAGAGIIAPGAGGNVRVSDQTVNALVSLANQGFTAATVNEIVASGAGGGLTPGQVAQIVSQRNLGQLTVQSLAAIVAPGAGGGLMPAIQPKSLLPQTLGLDSSLFIRGASIISPGAGDPPRLVVAGEMGGNGRAGSNGFAVDTSIAGAHRPGGSPGMYLATGAYRIESTGTLEIELAGTAPVTQHDFLGIDGVITAGGVLAVKTLYGHVPAATNAYTVADSPLPIAGAFTNVVAGGRVGLTDGSGTLRAHYGPGSAHAAGKLVLDSYAAAFSYAAWRTNGVSSFTVAEAGTAVVSGPAADPDGDGLPNQWEYIAGASPKVADMAPVLWLETSANGVPMVNFRRAVWFAGRVTLEVATSLNGPFVPVALPVTRVSSSSGSEVYQSMLPAEDHPALYLRLRADIP